MSWKERKQRQNRRLSLWTRRIALSLLLLVLVAVLSLVPVVRDSETRFADSFFRIAAAPAQASAVVLVLIDEDSLRQYGRWPWSREILSQLVVNLTSAGARVIGLDILLSEPQSAQADATLQESLQANGHAVLVGKIGAFPDGPHWVEPLQAFSQAAAAIGHVQTVLDVDSVCRRFPPRELTIDGPRLAFAVEVARQADPLRASEFLHLYSVPASNDGVRITLATPTLVRIPFRRDGFETVSASTVLRGSDLGTRFRGRPVLVGFGATEIGDRLNTPLATEIPAPGIEVHAQILDAILTGRSLREVSPALGALAVGFTCLIVVIALRGWRNWASVGLLVGLAIAVYGIAFLTFLWASRVLPAGAMLLAVIMGPSVVFTADFVMVERSLTQQLLGLRSWLTKQGKESAIPRNAELSWKLELLHKLETELGSLYQLHKTLLECTQDMVAIFDEKDDLLLTNHGFATVLPPSTSRLTLAQLHGMWVSKHDAPIVDIGTGQEGEVYLDEALYFVRIALLPPTRLTPGGGTVVTLTNLQTRVERDRARAEALAFITHELRTPVASIQGFADLMVRYPGSPDCDGAAETILWESKRLLALINSYLDVLRMDAGAKPVRADALEIHDVVRQVFDILRPLASAANMHLVLETSAAVVAIGDTPLISGAILNLVSNAIKYGKSGTEIRVRCSNRNESAIISVQNQSEPIAEKEIPHLFDAYYRGRSGETRTPGWGLGLAFVKRVAEKHGGSVRAESGRTGMTFEICLPARTDVEVPSEVKA